MTIHISGITLLHLDILLLLRKKKKLNTIHKMQINAIYWNHTTLKPKQAVQLCVNITSQLFDKKIVLLYRIRDGATCVEYTWTM